MCNKITLWLVSFDLIQVNRISVETVESFIRSFRHSLGPLVKEKLMMQRIYLAFLKDYLFFKDNYYERFNLAFLKD